MEICNNREKCCCFTGHRPHKLGISEREAKKLLSDAVDMAIENGYTTFISGMAQGIDMWAAEVVIEKRKSDPTIFLVCASPYPQMADRWQEWEKAKFKRIISSADEVKYICEHYTPYCFHARNNWMVNHSSLVIAAYDNEDGGTKNTVQYALNSGIKVINIFINSQIK